MSRKRPTGAHPPNNTFPGEVFMRLSADALQLAAVHEATE
jgi:hypothetical protein